MRRFAAACILSAALAAPVLAPAPAWAVYLLDYGDAVAVSVKGQPQYGYTGPVRPDGVVSIPFLGDVEVRGLTPDQVRDRVKTLVSRVVIDPVVTVAVTAYRPRYVTVVGEVAKPGIVEVTRADQSVLDTIALAGGLTDHALPESVVVLRGNGAATRRIPVDLKHMMETGDLTANVRLEPGDRVQVPRTSWPTWHDVLTTAQSIATVAAAVTVIVTLTSRTGILGQ